MAEKWTQKLDIKKGALRAKAKKAGGMNKEGKIKESFIDKEEHSKNPRTKKQAVLAKTFAKMRKK
jgi:hypothetical protein